MGYSFIPLFLGNIFAGFISGDVYQQLSDKHTLLLKEVEKRGLTIPGDLSHNQYFEQVASQLNMSNLELTNYLWTTYQPGNIWIVIISIGIFSAAMMWLYNRFVVTKY